MVMSCFHDRRRQSGLYTRVTTVNILRFLWICLIVWCEIGAFFWSLSNCRWPDKAFKKIDRHASPSHLMIIADQHYKASTQYRKSASWPTRFVEFVVELYLRKSWNAATRLNPHVVIMLGDMLESGRAVMTDEQYDQYQQRFSETFKMPEGVQTYYATGNHDVGLGSHRAFSGQARRRFRQRFGPEQQVVDFGNHTLVFIDAPALVDEDYRRHAAEIDFESWQGAKAGPISFVKAVKNTPPPANRPTIMLSHIPLARRETAECGPLREDSKGIRRGAGYGYQNLLGRETTHFVLQSLRPSLVISGDDHDYCDHIHRAEDGDIREITVKTFNMGLGVKRPGFLLLSLYTPPQPDATPQRADSMCLLPDQLRLYTFIYLPFFAITLGYIAYINYITTAPKASRKPGDLAPLRVSGGGSGSQMYDTPPSTPSHLMVRRSASSANLPGTLTPRSRPSSPMLGPRTLFGDDENTSTVPLSPIPRHANAMPSPLLPSLMSMSAEPDEIEDGLLAPNAPPRVSRESSASKKWANSQRERKAGWRSALLGMADFLLEGIGTVLMNRGFHPSGKRKWASEGLRWRILGDVLHTAWPPLFVLGFIWWRLLTW